MYNRTNLLNDLILHGKFKSYLEIGVFNPKRNFDKIKCSCKIGVDPSTKAQATICATSDDFFSSNKKTFDLIFIDGLHHCDQVIRDFENSIKVLNKDGIIVFHDCNPIKEAYQIVPQQVQHWNGDVWKAWVDIRISYDNLEMFVVNIDEGCGVLKRNNKFKKCNIDCDFTYQYLDKNRVELLNLISLEKFKEWINANYIRTN